MKWSHPIVFSHFKQKTLTLCVLLLWIFLLRNCTVFMHIGNSVLFSKISHYINRSLTVPSAPPSLILYEKGIRIKVSIFACGRIHSAHLHVKTDLYQKDWWWAGISQNPHWLQFINSQSVPVYDTCIYSNIFLFNNALMFCSTKQSSVLPNNPLFYLNISYSTKE